MENTKKTEHSTHADVYSFLKAAKANRIAEVKEAIARGLDVNSRNEDFDTALHFAAANGHFELARLLVELGADVNKVDILGFTPFLYAVSKRHVDIARLLAENGANHQQKSRLGATPLSIACASGSSEMVKFLLEDLEHNPNEALDPRIPSPSPIIAACVAVNLGAIELLKRSGVNVDEKPAHFHGLDAYYVSSKCGKDLSCDRLLALGADAQTSRLRRGSPSPVAPPRRTLKDANGNKRKWVGNSEGHVVGSPSPEAKICAYSCSCPIFPCMCD
ncbi:ankyrin repeat protein [Aphelenchoides avenae]|nr:ankyrin repeat protein [Aphelenchus avenae]